MRQSIALVASALSGTQAGALPVDFPLIHLATYATLLVAPLFGCLYAYWAYRRVAAVDMDSYAELEGAEKNKMVAQMRKLGTTIEEGAMAFLRAEYTYLAVFISLFSVLVFFVTSDRSWTQGAVTTGSFVFGALTSMLCGWIGMRIATYTNTRTAFQCWRSLEEGFEVALQGGAVMGLSLVSLGVVALFGLVLAVEKLNEGGTVTDHFHAIAGFGLGGSSIALFGRVGGGIFTKAADVGADLAGKNEWGLDEDDYRNPAVIADNVGDNVGDIAGMGADLFGSFAEATCAAMVLVSSQAALNGSLSALLFPLLLSAAGIKVGITTLCIRRVFWKVEEPEDVEKALKGLLVISTVLMTPVVTALSWGCLPGTFDLDTHAGVHWWYAAISIVLGLWSGLLIGYVTEYYTSHSYAPVREIAETQKQSAATGIIYGLAVGYLSTIVPVLCLGITILVAHSLCGFFGVALGAIGMLGTMTMALTIDAYGPISDNAGGIAEMSSMPQVVRERTDVLDSAGNTTAAIGKGFAIGSAALVSLALFGAFAKLAGVGANNGANILDPWIFAGLLSGAMLPYAFAAFTMKSVGVTANDMVVECMAQFPRIMGDEQMEPDYDRCIDISTKAALREMLAPSALVIISPLVAGLVFGRNCCAGLLLGSLVSSVQLAISMSNTGGAWDNSKKYITAGGLGQDCGKGSEAHKNSVTGDTVGDPLKDTSGPALNIVMKLTAIISLVFATEIGRMSNASGGPLWLEAAQS